VFRRFSVPYLQLGGRKTCECAAAFKLSPNAIKAQLLGLGLEVRRILEDTTAHFLRIDDCSSGERRSAVKNSRHHPRPFQKSRLQQEKPLLARKAAPAYRCRTFKSQNKRKPFRCQPMTVAALTIKTLDCELFQTAHSQAQSNRSAGVSFGRLTERCR
jgi:hypothetical protein